jgi:hypothetical protein
MARIMLMTAGVVNCFLKKNAKNRVFAFILCSEVKK